jgi:Ribonuclease G/E
MSVDQQSPELQILKAVQALDTKLSDALNRQTRTLTASIQALADRHSESLLEQEKRNNTFADRNRLEAIAEHGHTSANLIQALIIRTTAAEARAVELTADLQNLRTSISTRTENFLAGTNGYLLTFIFLVIVAVISAVVTRMIR